MSKRKLLLADDSITIQKVVNLTFADEGIEVIAVGDGDSAMRKFDEFIPDLVMADVNMPGINGYEMCRIIKRTDETEHIPVILLVGSFEPFDEEEAREVGADDFLTKPFQSIRQLVNKVTDLLNRKNAAPPAEEASEGQASAPRAVDSFADTLEFEKREAGALEFGDAGMDDEMIEASAANDYQSGESFGYQRETTIDYAKTQPLSTDDLKGFDSDTTETPEAFSETTEQPSAESPQSVYETIEPVAPIASPQASEPPSFDEEARKLGYHSPAEETGNSDDYSYRETENFDEDSLRETERRDDEESPDNLSESEPQLDYALATPEPEFEKEMTDAETLAPEVSDTPEAPREADFSQAEEEASSEQAESEQAEETESDETESEEAPEEATEPVETSTAPMSESEFAEVIQPPRAGETTDEYAAPVETETEFEESAAVSEAPAAESVSATEAPTVEFEYAGETADVSGAPAETESAEELETPNQDAEKIGAGETRAPEMIDETPMAAATTAEIPPIDFAGDDLLDLPPLVEETGIRPQPKPAPVVPEVVAPAQSPQLTESESKITVTKTVAESEIALSFTPELIEAIAQRVADKISAQTMTEVLPQIADLVVKKLAERENQK